MNPDDFKAAWQNPSSHGRLTMDPDLLLKEVRRNENWFAHSLFWRDLREVGVSLALIPLWFYWGAKEAMSWTWYLMVPALAWVTTFMLVDRCRHRREKPEPAEPLALGITRSLAQVNHQIWLLRNVFWWYLLPPALAISAFLGQATWEARDSGWRLPLVLGGVVLLEILVFAGVYWLNQQAIRSELEPRRLELQALLASLGESPASGPTVINDTPKTNARPLRATALIGIAALLAATAALSLLAHQMGKTGTAPFNAAFCPAAGDAAVTNILVPIRQEHRLPAMAAALVSSKGIVCLGVVGTRKQDAQVAATLDDRWHLGSDGKAMTATLLAKLVEQGRLRWDATVGELFPDLAPSFHADARSITVVQLLSHRSGLPPNPDLVAYGGHDGTKERLRVVKDALSIAPNHKPATHFEYSNLGYSIAGAIAEKVTGNSWEQAMRDEIFTPLGMTSVGFGGTGTPGQVDQPWGHDDSGQPVASNGPGMDNPPVLSPAGRIHCTIQDWARFIADQLRGARGQPALLKPESYQKLQTPPFGGDYALGWLVVERDWGGGTVLNHGGDNTMNCANVWVAPRRDFAILVCINQTGNTAFQASDQAIGALIQLHSKNANQTQTTGAK